jgi:hypothetical protein
MIIEEISRRFNIEMAEKNVDYTAVATPCKLSKMANSH